MNIYVVQSTNANISNILILSCYIFNGVALTGRTVLVPAAQKRKSSKFPVRPRPGTTKSTLRPDFNDPEFYNPNLYEPITAVQSYNMEDCKIVPDKKLVETSLDVVFNLLHSCDHLEITNLPVRCRLLVKTPCHASRNFGSNLSQRSGRNLVS